MGRTYETSHSAGESGGLSSQLDSTSAWAREKGAMSCEAERSNAVQQRAGEAEAECTINVVASDRTYYKEAFHFSLTRLPGDKTWHPLTVKGYLYDPNNSDEKKPDPTQGLPAAVHAGVIEASGDPLTADEWYNVSLGWAVQSRGWAAGWIPWW